MPKPVCLIELQKKKEQFFLERMGEGGDFWSDAHAFVLVFVQRLPRFVCFLNMGEKRCLHPSFKALLRNYTAKFRTTVSLNENGTRVEFSQ